MAKFKAHCKKIYIMRILHTADWHLGKKLDYFSRLDEQKEVLEEICQIADREDVDLIILAGDLYDNFNPPVEAIELLYRTLKRLSKEGKRPVIAIAGNHDSPDRVDSVDPLARECGIFFIGRPNQRISPLTVDGCFDVIRAEEGFLEIKIPKYYYSVRILHTPFANEIRLKKNLGQDDSNANLQRILTDHWRNLASRYCDNYGVNILTTHTYMLKRNGEVFEEPEGEKPIRLGYADLLYSDMIPPSVQYTALGHLHRCHNIAQDAAPVVYSGSPLAYSFSESGQRKHVVVVDLEPNQQAAYKLVDLSRGRPLKRKKVKSIDEAVRWLQEHQECLVELTVESDTFLNATDLKNLYGAHDGIIHIVPLIKNSESTSDQTALVNLDQDMEGLFSDYFRSRYGQAPNNELMALFDETIHGSQDVEEGTEY